MKWFRSRRALAALVGFGVLALFVIRPSVGSLRTRIARSISAAIGRQVEISSASLRLLPQPGFELENFVVHDDPAFSLEPVLRSDDVIASLRITSLLRGRFEIARLSLSEPSLNLVRNVSGHWNLEYLLDRSAHTSAAPTSKPATEKRPAFPYIEADGGRINFKLGMEKTQFAMTEADFALFQDSENSWGARVAAKPVRTDSNFSDTGLLKITGTWQRAESLHETPLRFSVQWQHAQLGQVTKLIYGSDKGWRGTAALSAEISGTPAELAIVTQASVDDFRRYDILAGSAMRLRAQCGANYSSTTSTVSNIICESPVGDGALTLHGNLVVSLRPTYRLSFFAQDVPLQALISLARHSKKDIPDDLVGAGTVDGAVRLERDKDAATVWEGSGDTSEFRLASQVIPAQLPLPRIHFLVSSADAGHTETHLKKGRLRILQADDAGNSQETRVEVSPFTIALGGTAPATVQGSFSRYGYAISIAGDAQLRRLLLAAGTIGIPAPHPDADGEVSFNLKLADNWSGFKVPRVTGSAELHSVRTKIAGLKAPLEIDNAKLFLDADQVSVQSVTASLGGAVWHGSLVLPRPCGVLETCPIQVKLHADEIATDRLGTLFTGRTPWYQFLMASQKPSYLSGLRATGNLTTDRILVHKFAATHFSADFDLDRGKLHLTNLRAAALGGAHSGEWTLDFTTRPFAYSGAGSFQHVVLAQLASAMHDNWISGTATATYHASASGANASEIFSSATGILQVEARDGMAPHIALTNLESPLQLRHFDGRLILRHQELDFEHAQIETNSGVYQVTGTAALNRSLNLKLTRAVNRGFTIAGTLGTPVISRIPISETQAALKP